MNLLKVTDYITITQDGEKLHAPLHFELNKGDILWVRGANGSGKTSFLKTLIKHQKRHSGKIDLQVQLDQMAYLPQLTQPHFFIPLHLHDLLEKKDFTLMSEEQLHRNWNTASGGERQKTLLIKTFHQPAHIYLLDEPTNQLDQKGREILKQQLDQVLKNKDKAIMIICHDEGFMAHFKTKEIHLRNYGN